MKRFHSLVAASSFLAVCAPLVASAATVDGLNIPADFAGHVVATQTIQTNYLNDTTPQQGFGEGSELDQLFVHPNITGGFLRIGITGNLDTYPSRGPVHGIVVFLDTRPGGDAVLDRNSGGAFTDGDRYVTLMEGTRFDAGFAPDYAVIVNAANPGHLPKHTFYIDLIDLQANTKRYVGRGLIGSGHGQLVEGDNPGGMLFAVDNRNTLGVAGNSPSAPDPNAATATTGIEMAIPTRYLGLSPHQPLGIQALLSSTWSSTRHPNGVSNQVLPPFLDYTPGTWLGYQVDFQAFTGNQFATVQLVPEPLSLALLIPALAISVGLRLLPPISRLPRRSWPSASCM